MRAGYHASPLPWSACSDGSRRASPRLEEVARAVTGERWPRYTCGMVHQSIPPGEYVPTADSRVILHNVPWSHYETQLALRGDTPVPRIAYLDGVMELMRPSREHERLKCYIGMLIEAYALERGVDLSPYGGWTIKHPAEKSGVEPDECYLIGDQSRDRPDLAIEVVWTTGGLEKLEAYRRLEVREVWFWKSGRIEVHVLEAEGTRRAAASALLPGLDVALLTSFLDHPTAIQAVKAFRAALNG
jgi:Uma2 family endonuclease